ncbi:hypothetical protein STRCI_003097 [Streptomyces cinnabarinus]|uniref:Uncharacterized protein n=1 Tax=Streptomyces cinnabarinus TaxID=67287 RepID=A0ABY7KCT3_9ACTN|nr:hypothetical protein [Streptomyces cinnabarinus]WAZ21893.1 hypothetical protein STRCI_003097 [Streptomyces cinnabarinus]
MTFYLDKWPDGDTTRHIATSGTGGGTRLGDQKVKGGDSAKKSMGFSRGCFYWNARQYEAILEADGEDNFMGQIED